jgi:hypothetical protein
MTYVLPKLYRTYGPEPDDIDRGIMMVLLRLWGSDWEHDLMLPRVGDFWFFHYLDQCADNGIGLSCGCRVFKVIDSPAVLAPEEA